MEIQEGLGFKELIVNTVEEFIELIRPDKKNVKEYLGSVNDQYIYRGQADSSWELTPSLYRNISREEILSDTYDGICFMHCEPYRVCRRPSFLRECPDEKSKIYP